MAEILVLCSRTPYPPVGGAKLRLFNTARILASEHEVDLLVVDEAPVPDERIDALTEVVRSVELFAYPSYRFYLNAARGLPTRTPLQAHYFRFGGVQDWVDDHVADYDLAFANHVRTTEYLRDCPVPTVVDLVDAISRNYAELGAAVGWPRRLLYDLEGRRLTRYERRIVSAFDRSLIVTDADRRHVVDGLDGAAADRLTVLPNGVDERLLKLDPETADVDPDRITFLGKMDYLPNEDAAAYFASEVFPLVRERHPDAEFVVVGASPTDRVSNLADLPGVRVTGFVEDPAEYLRSSAAVVAPLRHGAGLQNKVLEAMALGRPVVTTPLGAEGIDAEDGTHLLVADGAEPFADAVAGLFEEPARRERIGTAGRDLVATTYRWEDLGRELLAVVDAVLDDAGSRRGIDRDHAEGRS